MLSSSNLNKGVIKVIASAVIALSLAIAYAQTYRLCLVASRLKDVNLIVKELCSVKHIIELSLRNLIESVIREEGLNEETLRKIEIKITDFLEDLSNNSELKASLNFLNVSLNNGRAYLFLQIRLEKSGVQVFFWEEFIILDDGLSFLVLSRNVTPRL